MPNYANITVIGHLGRDPEAKTFGENTVVNFSVAVTEKRKNKEPLTTWYDVAAWNGTGAFAEKYLKKGSAALISGTPSAEKYTDKNGVEKTKFVIRADKVVGVGARAESDGEAQDADAPLKPNENMDAVKAQIREMEAKAAAAPRNPNDPPF